VGCCVLEAVAGFLLYFCVPVLDPVDSEVQHDAAVVLEEYFGVLVAKAGVQKAGHVLVTQGQHFPPLL